jgi:preprotein translocase subunit SecE
MATKAALVRGDDEPSWKKPIVAWNDFTRFLSEVRSEMRKVVTPSRKEVEATTTVVIVAVFIFGLFFFVVDWIFGLGLDRLLKRLGGLPD